MFGCLLGEDERGAHVRSSHGRYTDFQAFMSKMRDDMREGTTSAATISCLQTPAAKKENKNASEK